MSEENIEELDDLTEESTEEGQESEPVEETETSEETSEEEDKEEEGKEEKEEETEEEKKEKETKEKEEDSKLTKSVFKRVKETYPDLFKKFPELRADFFRAQEYSKLFPTVDDAKEAADSARRFNLINDELIAGNSGNILDAVRKADPDSFEKLTNSFLPSLARLDKETYYQVTQPVIELALQAAYKEGVESDNKNLQLAARHIKKFLFNEAEFKESGKGENRVDPEKTRLLQERDSLLQNQARAYESDVTNQVDAKLRSLIARDVDNLEVSDFIKDKITNEIIRQANAQLDKDQSHMSMMQDIWNKVKRSNLSPAYKERLVTAYMNNVSDLIPAIKTKVIGDAMGKKTDKKTIIKRPSDGGTDKTGGSGKIDPNKVDWDKTSEEDYLNHKITYKK